MVMDSVQDQSGVSSHLLFLLYLQPHLAVGSNDYYMSIYSAEKRLR